jgi:prefoldin subunit 5
LNDTHKEISILLKHKEELEMERDKLLKELESKSKDLMKLESEYDEYRR